MIIFQWLDDWLASDILHFNFFVGMIMLISFASIIVLSLLMKKIGSEGERKYIIKLRIGNIMFTSLLLFLTLFILWIPTDSIFYRQYLIALITLSLLVGTISTIYFYWKQRVS